jgi:Rieske Fe-S protein
MTPLSSRRDFVRTCGAVGASLVTIASGGCAAAVLTRVAPENGRVRIRVSDYPALARRGGSLRLLPDGAPDEVLVLRQDDGSFAVLSSVCTHSGCTVETQPSRIVCPCHGSTYDRAGRVMVGPAERPLTRYRATLSGGDVLEIDLGGAS